MNRGREIRDDVVLQSADDVRVRVPVFHTAQACAGAVTAYLLRHIAYRAGAYAPGIQEVLFHELTTTAAGSMLGRVQGWMEARTSTFHGLGYRLHAKWIAEKSEPLAKWVREGRGYRGATLATDYGVLHPKGSKEDRGLEHAVGLAFDRLPDGKEEELVMIDPWPGVGNPDRVKVPPNLDVARRDHKFNALLFYWVGWS